MSDTGGLLQGDDSKVIENLKRILIEKGFNIEELQNIPPLSPGKIELQKIIYSTLDRKRLDGGGLTHSTDARICMLIVTEHMKAQAKACGLDDCDREVLAIGAKTEGVNLHISINQRIDLKDIAITIRSFNTSLFNAASIVQQLGGDASGSNNQLARLSIKGDFNLASIRRIENTFKVE